MAQGSTKFEICKMVAKGVRITHKQGTRLEDSITQVLGMLSPEASLAPVKIATAGSRA
jgi:hypothetical protein